MASEATQCLSDCCSSADPCPIPTADETAGEEGISFDDGCCICLDLLVEPVQLACNHVFCQHCIAEWCLSQGLDGFCCPQCKSQDHTAHTIRELRSQGVLKRKTAFRPIHNGHKLFPAHRELSDSQLNKYGERYQQRLKDTYQSRIGALDKLSWQLQRYDFNRNQRARRFRRLRRQFKWLMIGQILIFLAIVVFSVYYNTSPNSNAVISSVIDTNIDETNVSSEMSIVETPLPTNMCPNPLIQDSYVWRSFKGSVPPNQCLMMIRPEVDPLVSGLCAVFSDTTGVSEDWCHDQAGQVERAIIEGLRKEKEIWSDLPNSLLKHGKESSETERIGHSSDDAMPSATPLILLFRRMFISSPLLNLIIELFHYFTE